MPDRFEPINTEARSGREVKQLSIVGPDASEGRVAQLSRIRGDRLEHWLHVALRLADHPQDFAGRCLLLQRLGQVSVARLQLVKQPCVLDCDHRLVGEGLEHGRSADP